MIEFSGLLTWEDFQSAISEVEKLSRTLGDNWGINYYQQNTPGGSYLSYIRYIELENNLLKCEYHIIYSLSYSVPVMYFNISYPNGKLLSVTEVCQYLKKSVSEVSQQEHPLLQVPFFCLHPCNTDEIMKSLSIAHHNSPLKYLVSWLSLVTQVLNIPLPNEYGVLLNH